MFSPTVQKLILEEQDHRLGGAIRVGKEDGMQNFTQSLKKLVDDQLIDREVALEVAPNREELKMALKGIDVSQGGMI
jgi:twitching motility protein PilT